MNREEIELSEHVMRSLLDEDYDNYNEEENIGYTLKTSIIEDTDIEKGIEWTTHIINRDSDNKTFKFHHGNSYYNPIFEYCSFPIKLKEVFPKIITKVIYE